MSKRVSRRTFLKQGAFAGVTILVGPGLARTYAQNGKLNSAMVAVGGRGGAAVAGGAWPRKGSVAMPPAP